LSTLISKAESGDALAQYELASILAAGYLGEKNLEASFYWYMKAALRGHVEAMWSAGLQLVQGVGVEKANEAGLYLINLAASRYCCEAINFLAYAYEKGLHGVSKDKQKSEYLHHLADSL
jgi:TPR repeat protein